MQFQGHERDTVVHDRKLAQKPRWSWHEHEECHLHHQSLLQQVAYTLQGQENVGRRSV